MGVILDDWQKKVIQTEGNVLLISGRRVGKSEVLAMDASEYACNNANKSVLVISHTERQAYWLFEKILNYIMDNHKGMIKTGKEKPTKSQLRLKNKSIIRCLPTGLSGSGIRGIHADRIYPDECDYIEEAVWQAITPMLLTTGGCIRASTTPNPSKEKGYVYHNMFKNPKFTVFNISTEDVINNRPISKTWTQQQREDALAHLQSEKETMTKLAYAVEYLGQWVDNLKRFYPEELIRQRAVLKNPHYDPTYKTYLGVDVARLGHDLSSFQIVQKISRTHFIHIHSEVTKKQYTTQTYEKILQLAKMYNVSKIGLDAGSGSLGVGLLDFLLQNDAVKNKVVALNNRARALDKDGKKKSKLAGEDMHQNLLSMMEHGTIKLLDDDDVKQSLRSVQFDVKISPDTHRTSQFVFTHINSDIVEGLKRAAWLANEDKRLNIYCYF